MGEKKGSMLVPFLWQQNKQREAQSILYVAVILQHISFGDERKGKENLIFFDKGHRKNS